MKIIEKPNPYLILKKTPSAIKCTNIQEEFHLSFSERGGRIYAPIMESCSPANYIAKILKFL